MSMLMTDVQTATMASPEGARYVVAYHARSRLQVLKPATDDEVADRDAALADLQMVLGDAQFVRSAVGQGASLDEVARILVQGRGRPPLLAYRALQAGGAAQMAQAQALVRRNLAPGSPALAPGWWEGASWELQAPEAGGQPLSVAGATDGPTLALPVLDDPLLGYPGTAI